jgi:hypothetical protein
MVNVLPEGARKSVWSFYRSRFILIGSIGLCISGLCAILALLPAYVALRTEGTFAGAPSIDAGVQRGKDSERDQILHTRMLLDQFSAVASSSAPVLDALVSALAKRPPGVVVDRMSYRRNTGGDIAIGGVATSRDGVNTYVAALRLDPTWSNISVPIGDLAGTGDGRFSITLTGTF